MKKISLQQVPKISKLLKDKSVEDILIWAHKRFGDRLGMVTGFGYSGVALMHHIYKLDLKISIYFIDTGYHFPQTLKFAKQLGKKWKLKIIWLKAEGYLRKHLLKIEGSKPWKSNPNLCCHYCKVEPLLRVLFKKEAWLSALRCDQSYSRSLINIVEMDGRGTFKIYPLAKWTKIQTWEYIKKNKLPYNPLYDKGYLSIGCKYCTVPVIKGGDERDGRWKSTPKFECGIHIHKGSV